jgi:integrase
MPRGAGRRSQREQARAFSAAEEGIMSQLLLDAAGRRRSPATLPEFHAGRAPQNKGMRYPGDRPTIEEIVIVMRRAGDGVHGLRLRGLIVVLWRAGLRIHEALALAQAGLDRRRGSLVVRPGKGGRRGEVGMDAWAWEQLAPWLDVRVELPVGPLFCVVNGPTRGRPWSAAAARSIRQCRLSRRKCRGNRWGCSAPALRARSRRHCSKCRLRRRGAGLPAPAPPVSAVRGLTVAAIP